MPKSATMSLREFPGGSKIDAHFGFQWNEIIQYLFFLFSCFSYMEYLIAILLAAMHLQWTDALSPDDMMQYHKDNPMAPAAPLIWLFCAACWHLLATGLLYHYSHHEIGWSFGLILVLGLSYLGKELIDVSSWAPEGTEGHSVFARSSTR